MNAHLNFLRGGQVNLEICVVDLYLSTSVAKLALNLATGSIGNWLD